MPDLTSLLTALVLASSIPPAPADSSLVELDPIIVTAQREPARLSRIVNSAVALPPSEIQETQYNDIVGLLAERNASISLSSVRTAGYGVGSAGQGRLLIRGLGFAPNRGSLVLIDGRPDIAGLFGHPLPDTYRRAGTRSADLIKGASSTLFGSNAVAGVLNIESFYRPDLDAYSNLELSAGSFDTYNTVIQHSEKIGPAIVAGWYEYIESANSRANSDYVNRSGGFRAQFTRDGHWSAFLSGKYSSFDFSDPGPVYNPTVTTGDIARLGTTLGIDYRRSRVSASLRSYVSYGEHAFSDGFVSVDRNQGIDLFGRYQVLPGEIGLTVSGGLSASRLGGSAHDGTPFVLSGDKSEDELAAHLQIETNVQQTVTVIAGGRLIDHDRYGSHAVYQLGTVVRPGQLGSFKASVATAYRNPTVSETELFRISNPGDLLPEEGTFYEAGYFNRLSEHLSLEAALFWRNGSNLIAVAPAPGSPAGVRFQNVGKYDHSGWEATVRWVDGDWIVRPSFMHLNQDSYNLSVPEDKLVAAGEYHGHPLAVQFEIVAAFRTRSDSAGTPVVLDNYLTANIGHRYRINEHLQLNLQVDNLFDESYAMVAGYPMPGITFRSGLTLRWE